MVASSNPYQLDGTPPTRNPPMFRAAGHVHQGDLLTFTFVGGVVGPQAVRPLPTSLPPKGRGRGRSA